MFSRHVHALGRILVVNDVLDAALGPGLAGLVQDVLDGKALVKAAHVHQVLPDSPELAALRELPQDPLDVDVGTNIAVLGNEQGILLECQAQMPVKECLAGINHGFAAIVILDDVHKHLDTVAQPVSAPVLVFLDVNYGNQVLLIAVGRLQEVDGLGPRAGCRPEEMVATHLKAVLAGIPDVFLVLGIHVVATLRGLDIDKFYFGVLSQFFPIDGTLML